MSALGVADRIHLRAHVSMIWERAFGGMLLKEPQYLRISSWCYVAEISHCSATSKLVGVIEMFSKLLFYYYNKSFNSTLLIRMSFSN